ncbi:MAG: lipid-A-disaccharide synthase [Cryomorphaceae bacterium]|nr:lipid-A-disaccharide synthase [Cryomorphaceae bacterium]
MPCDYYIIAGEASGDLHGSNLIKAIKAKQPDATFRIWGGDKMATASESELVVHYREMAFMGFIEVLKNIRTIARRLKQCKADLLEHNPQVLVLIDYPGFNMRIAKFAKDHGIKVAWYIAPQVWAWKENRVKTLKRITDLMLVILPFETSFFAKHDMEVTYVGHPLLDHLHWNPSNTNIQPTPTIALLPGSRKQEINSILPRMLEVVPHFPDATFVISRAPSQSEDVYLPYLSKQVVMSDKNSYDLLSDADAALVTSGTATLETALIGIPQIVCYLTSPTTYQLAKFFIKVPFISLVNLIAEREVVTELIQNKLIGENLKTELEKILDAENRKEMLNAYKDIREKLGGHGASERAAEQITNLHQSTKDSFL